MAVNEESWGDRDKISKSSHQEEEKVRDPVTEKYIPFYCQYCNFPLDRPQK